VLYAVLKDDKLRFLSPQEEWKAVAHDFGKHWNKFHFLGAMDGRHFVIQPLHINLDHYIIIIKTHSELCFWL